MKTAFEKVKLGDVCDTISKTYKGNAESVVLINTSDVLEGKVLNHEKVKNEDLRGQFKKTFESNDILYSEIRPKNKRFAFVNFDPVNYIASTKLMVIRAKENIRNEFLFALLKSNLIIEELQMLAETRSGTFPQITFSELSNISINLPPLTEQKKIAKILSDIDDKIECNNDISKNLEEMASALYKRWFVDFEFPNADGNPYKSSGGEFIDSELGSIPLGWKVSKLGNFVTDSYTGGDAIQKTPIVDYDTGIRCLRIGDLTNNKPISKWGFSNVKKEHYKKYKLNKGNIVVSRTSVLGINKLIVEDLNSVFNNGCIKLDIEKYEHSLYVYANINCETYFDYINCINGESSTRPNMKMDYLLNYRILNPSDYVLTNFADSNIILINNINNLTEENQRLAELRDSLLPRLMSGELDVSNIELDI